MDNTQAFETNVLPQSFINYVLILAHDKLGHNGCTRTYKILKRLHYWKGLKPVIHTFM